MGSACLECGIQRQATARLRWTSHCAAIGCRSLGFCARGARRGAASRDDDSILPPILFVLRNRRWRLLAKAIVSCSTEAPLPLGPPSCLAALRCVRWGLRGKYAAAREREANS